MATLSLSQLRELLLNQKQATFISVVTDTEPRMRKTNNPYFGRLRRLAKRSGMLSANYEGAVNRQRAREGIEEYFISEELWGGKGEYLSAAMARHKENLKEYLVFFPTKTDTKGNPVASVDSWELDGKECDEQTLADVKTFLSGGGSPVKQGTEKAIPWRVIELRNVKQITMNGKTYDVKG